jgi:hypothetical protein
MKTWKSRLFGDNLSNLYCFNIAGFLVIAGSMLSVMQALSAGAQSAESRLLLAIYLILMGRFCLVLQTYSARIVKKLESEENK